MIPRFWAASRPPVPRERPGVPGTTAGAEDGFPPPGPTARRDARDRRLADLLLEVWDPVGVASQDPAVRDVHERHVDRIRARLAGGASAPGVAALLTEIERTELGLTPAPDRLARIAATLVDRWSAPVADDTSPGR